MKLAALTLALASVLSAGATLADDHDVRCDHRGVSISGQGEVSVKPDRALLSMGVEAAGMDLKAVQAQVNGVVRKYLADAKTLGVNDGQISTAGMNLNPEYVWDEKERRQKFNGYRASRQIAIRVEQLDLVGDLMLKATADGINQVNPPVLESSKAKEFSRQALAKAAEDARSKAQLLADTLGVKLAALRSLNANDSSPSPPIVYAKAMMAEAGQARDGNAEIGFSTGEIKYSASVSAEFDLIAP